MNDCSMRLLSYLNSQSFKDDGLIRVYRIFIEYYERYIEVDGKVYMEIHREMCDYLFKDKCDDPGSYNNLIGCSVHVSKDFVKALLDTVCGAVIDVYNEMECSEKDEVDAAIAVSSKLGFDNLHAISFLVNAMMNVKDFDSE